MLGLILAANLLLDDAAAAPTPTPGTVFVVLAGNARDPDVDQPFADAVGRALGQADFTIMPDPGHSRYVAEVSIAREEKGIVATRVTTDRARAGIGSWGPALAVPLGSKKTRVRPLVLTTLTVRMVGRADHRLVWRASALTAQADGTAAGSAGGGR